MHLSPPFFPLQVYFFHLYTMDMCRFFYGCDRVYVYDGINNMKSIFSIYSVPFIRFTNALLRQWNMYLVLKPPTHEPLAFFLPFHVFFCIRQFVMFCYYIFVCLLDFFTHYWVIAIFFYWSFMKFFKSLYVIVDILDHQIYNSITEC